MNPNRRILVVDDNRAIHDDFHKIFGGSTSDNTIADFESALFGDAPSESKQGGYVIDSAYQGKEGLELVQKAIAESDPYQMAFVDMRMPPGWDGIETIAQIWRKYPDLQVVICTAYSDYSWDDMTKVLGISDRLLILKKPFDNIEVLQLAVTLTEKWRLLQETRKHAIELENRVALRTEELRKSEERFSGAFEHAPIGVALVSPDGRLIKVNRTLCELVGYSDVELLSRSFLDITYPDDLNAGKEYVRRTLAGEIRSFQMEKRYVHARGHLVTTLLNVSLVRDEQGEPRYFIAQIQDMTERKNIEIQLRAAQKLESIGQLAAGIAHEINTPTQFIGDNTRFVRDAFGDLRELFAANGRLLDAARNQSVTPAMIAEVEAAREKADLDYLLTEVPKAIGQSIEGIERVTKIVRAMKEFSHPGADSKTLLDLNHAIENTLTVCHSEWKYVADLVT
jgi:PAS domain S-box-containing protein